MACPTAHALLRDRGDWRGSLRGLAIADDSVGNGDLVLARVPAPADGRSIAIATPLPYPREASGLACGPCDAVFVADTAHDRVLFVDGLCVAQVALPAGVGGASSAPGRFDAPRGLACAADALLVADGGNARVQRLAFPRLEPHLAWHLWNTPVSIAVDAQGRALVIDSATGTLYRVLGHGTPDSAFDTAVAASGRLARPLFVAVDRDSRVLVADTQHDEVILFDAHGAFVATLPGPSGWQPGALACAGARVYVADAVTGTIRIFEMGAGPPAQAIGEVPGWYGPVTAMAVADDGTLLVKPKLDATFYRFVADAAFVPEGTLTVGPFDAGEDRGWERAFVEAALPTGCTVDAEVALAMTALPAPGPTDWLALPSADALLALVELPERRFAWLRLTLRSTDPSATPRLQQAQLTSAAEDYLDNLPQTYRYNDGGAYGFMSRWLRLMRSEFARVETLIDDMPRVADARFEPPDALGWLAQWFGLELPQIASNDERRALIERAVALLARRGTRHSIAEFVALHTGIEPVIVEAFTGRRLWVLGVDSRLDFDTRLPELDPLGMVVPDDALTQGCCPASSPPADTQPCSPCPGSSVATDAPAPILPIGRTIVGESGPLASSQIGLPLFAQEAYRFCVVVDAYRAADPQTLHEIARIVDREKPAHTDYRIELIAPEMRVGFQSVLGIDTIVGGEAPPLRLDGARLSMTTNLPPSDGARLGESVLDGALTLT
jgi:phage tail-like protein